MTASPSLLDRRVADGRFALADVLCVGPLIVLSAFNMLWLFVTPSLLGRLPLLDSALRGGTLEMITTGAFARVGKLPLWATLIAPIPTLMASDPFLYWAGRRYGRYIMKYLVKGNPRRERSLARGERFFARFGFWAILFAYFIPAPTVLFYLAAGETRMPFLLFITADLIGTLMWIGLFVALGWGLGHSAVVVAGKISDWSLWITLALVIGAMVLSGWRSRQAATS